MSLWRHGCQSFEPFMKDWGLWQNFYKSLKRPVIAPSELCALEHICQTCISNMVSNMANMATSPCTAIHLELLGTSLGTPFTTIPPRLFHRLSQTCWGIRHTCLPSTRLPDWKYGKIAFQHFQKGTLQIFIMGMHLTVLLPLHLLSCHMSSGKSHFLQANQN